MKSQNLKPLYNEFDRKEVPSLTPYLATGFFLLAYAMIFPLYIWWHYLIPLVLGGGLFLLLRRFCKPRYATVEYAPGEEAPKTDKAYKYAVVVLCIIILFSVLYGGMRSVKTYRKTVTAEYLDGLAGASVESMVDSSHNLLTVAKRYIPEDESLKVLEAAVSRSESAQKINSVDRNVPSLLDACEAVISKLKTLPLSEQDKIYRAEIEAQLSSDHAVLCGDKYNRSAEEYNKTLKGYPAKLFARLANVDELTVFTAEED